MNLEELKSKEEWYFTWWCEDLKKVGVIDRYFYEPNTFILANSTKYTKAIELKTKIKYQELVLLKNIVYTPDFLVEWNKDYDGVFYRLIEGNHYFNVPPFFAIPSSKTDKHYTFFEVKANFDKHNEIRMFTYHQKWLYEKHNIYVQLAKIPKLFKDTFVPERYLITDKAKQYRTINFEKRLIEQYKDILIRNRNKQLDWT